MSELFLHARGLRAIGTPLDPSLRVLDLSDNPLGALPDAIGALARLEFLYAARCELERLPDAIGGCASLRYLQVGGNRLRALPASIEGLASLQELRVEGNPLGALPDLRALRSLRELHARGCGLDALPDLRGLVALRWLDLRENRFTALPAWLDELPLLQKIDARWNPLATIDRAWIARLEARGCVVYT